MEIKTEADICCDAVKQLRAESGETLEKFWGRVGIKRSGGYRYENGTPIPRYVRITLFAIYVAGVEIDASTIDGAEALKQLAALQKSDGAKERAEKMQKALVHIKQASNLIKDI